jgi:hypothetical protein
MMRIASLPAFVLASLLALPGASAQQAQGQDFIEEARTLYKDVACGGPMEKPTAHCKELMNLYDRYRTKWLDQAMPFLAKLVPSGLPAQVVYPFGGGDLVTALATFPDATEFTTISLEAAGDVTKVKTVKARDLTDELARLRKDLANLFSVAHSKTTALSSEVRSVLPGQLAFTLVALAIHGYEPVSLRYFKFNPDGTLKYLSADDIAAMQKSMATDKANARELAIFGDAELTFRKTGDAAAPVKTLRHIAYNLDDKHLAADPSLIKHLEAKGKVTAMTKAASHLLWADEFSTIRKYLLDHMAWMISDSTGIPPRFAKPAGFVQDTYGEFDGPKDFGTVDRRDGEDFKALFKANPKTKLPFRYYGYPDNAHHGHVIVTRPKTP